MNDILRQEKKIVITRDEMSHFIGRLRPVMRQDAHNGLQGYPIRSLYFDTVTDSDFFDKVNGVEVRRKIRLRCYGPGQEYAKLELKQKSGEYQRKRSLTLSRVDAELLCRGDYRPLLSCPDDFAAEVYALINLYGYRPKAVVEYQRFAFLAQENNIRITFDHNITATESCFDLFSPSLALYPVWDPYLAIMEIKYNGFLLSYIKSMLDEVDRSTLSVSKYGLSRAVGYGNF